MQGGERDNKRAHRERDLQQSAQLLLTLDARLRVDEATPIAEDAVAADEAVVGEGLAEDLDLEDVCDDLLCLAVDVWMDQRDVVVACDHVSERRKSLLDTLDLDGVRKGIAEVLQLLVCRRRGDEQTVSVACQPSASVGAS